MLLHYITLWSLKPKYIKRGKDSEAVCATDKVIILGNSNLVFSAFGRFGELHDHVLLEQADFFLGAYHLKSTVGKTKKCKTWKEHKIVSLLPELRESLNFIKNIFYKYFNKSKTFIGRCRKE